MRGGRLQNQDATDDDPLGKKGNGMVRPINYLFCRYSIDGADGQIDDAGEFSFLSENQGGEHAHGREKDGARPRVLCTDPRLIEVANQRAHVFEIGNKPGFRARQQYDPATKEVVRSVQADPHTKFGQVITVPAIGAVAIRDKPSDDTLGSNDTVASFRSFVIGASAGAWRLNVIYANNADVDHALKTWRVSEYSYTVRPLNPTGGDLAKLRSEMFKEENIYQESGVVKAPPGQSLKLANGTIGQTNDLVLSGYGQSGVKGRTEDGNLAAIPKLAFSQDKEKNIRAQENSPRYMKISFERDTAEQDITLDVAGALVRFYSR